MHLLASFFDVDDGARLLQQLRVSKEFFHSSKRSGRDVHRGDDVACDPDDSRDLRDSRNCRYEHFARLVARGKPTLLILGGNYTVSEHLFLLNCWR